MYIVVAVVALVVVGVPGDCSGISVGCDEAPAFAVISPVFFVVCFFIVLFALCFILAERAIPCSKIDFATEGGRWVSAIVCGWEFVGGKCARWPLMGHRRISRILVVGRRGPLVVPGSGLSNVWVTFTPGEGK